MVDIGLYNRIVAGVPCSGNSALEAVADDNTANAFSVGEIAVGHCCPLSISFEPRH